MTVGSPGSFRSSLSGLNRKSSPELRKTTLYTFYFRLSGMLDFPERFPREFLQ